MIKPLPSFIDLCKETWALFQQKFRSLFVISIIEFITFSFLSFVVGLVLVIKLGLRLFDIFKLNETQASHLLSLTSGQFPYFIFVTVILILIFLLISAFFVVAKIYILEHNPTLRGLLKFSRSNIIRILLGVLVVGFIGFGTLWLFIFPGLIFFFLTSFIFFELVFTNESILNATKRSIAIIWQNFWPLLWRFILVFAISYVISNLLHNSLVQNNQLVQNFLSSIINTLINLFLLVYSYVLYTHAVARTSFQKSSSLVWFVVPAIFGWVIFLSIAFGGLSFLRSTKVFDEFKNNIEQSIEEDKKLDTPNNQNQPENSV